MLGWSNLLQGCLGLREQCLSHLASLHHLATFRCGCEGGGGCQRFLVWEAVVKGRVLRVTNASKGHKHQQWECQGYFILQTVKQGMRIC